MLRHAEIGAAVALAALGLLGCGESRGAHEGQLRPAHLPELVRFVRFGETTPEAVAARFTADHLYVTSSVGRALTVRARGPNTGRPYAYVNVTRRQNASGYVGELGDEYTLSFGFTAFEPDGPLLLFQIEIAQPSAEPSACAAAAELASGRGLDGCHPESVYAPSPPDEAGDYHACTSDLEGHPVEIHCASSSGGTRTFSTTVTLGSAGTP